MGADPQLTGVQWQWPAAASTLYCAQILNWQQTKHSILYNCSIYYDATLSLQNFNIGDISARYSLSNIANTTFWNPMISFRIDHFEPIPCHCLSGSVQRALERSVCITSLHHPPFSCDCSNTFATFVNLVNTIRIYIIWHVCQLLSSLCLPGLCP